MLNTIQYDTIQYYFNKQADRTQLEDKIKQHIISQLCSWIGTGGGGRSRPPRQNFSVTSVWVIFDQWGVEPPNPSDKSNTGCHPSWQLNVVSCDAAILVYVYMRA